MREVFLLCICNASISVYIWAQCSVCECVCENNYIKKTAKVESLFTTRPVWRAHTFLSKLSLIKLIYSMENIDLHWTLHFSYLYIYKKTANKYVSKNIMKRN